MEFLSKFISSVTSFFNFLVSFPSMIARYFNQINYYVELFPYGSLLISLVSFLLAFVIIYTVVKRVCDLL